MEIGSNFQRSTLNVQRSTCGAGEADAPMVRSAHGEHVALRPCPNPDCRCGAVAVQCLCGEVYMVVCPECQMQGPDSGEAAMAAIRWNKLPQPMAVDCSGCHKELHPGDRRLPVSHGICRECAIRIYGDLGREVFDRRAS